MNRRTFIKLTAAAVLLPSVITQSKAKVISIDKATQPSESKTYQSFINKKRLTQMEKHEGGVISTTPWFPNHPNCRCKILFHTI